MAATDQMLQFGFHRLEFVKLFVEVRQVLFGQCLDLAAWPFAVLPQTQQILNFLG